MATISRQQNNMLFGPTTGDKIRLGNTDLYVQIEKDLRTYGDEVVYGGGKTLRDGMGLANRYTTSEGSLDLVITNVTIIDPLLGVIKADVGIKDGKIAGIGKAGNPDVMDGVTPTLVTGPSTDAISGEHLILTAAGIDGHVHHVDPQQAYHCLSNGITTLIGGGIGPTDGTNGTTITSGVWNVHKMLEAYESIPINYGTLAKGNSSVNATLEEQILAGACGFKIHEDWGRLQQPSEHVLTVPTAWMYRWPYTPIRSTRVDLSRIQSPPLTAVQSTHIPYRGRRRRTCS